MKLLFEQHRSWLGKLLGESVCLMELSTVESLVRAGVRVRIDRVIVGGDDDGNRATERKNS